MPEHEPERHGTEVDEATAGYVLRRLTARRTVRAALALGALRRGPAAAAATFRAPVALEHPGPAAGRHLREPHLRVAHLSEVPITDATTPGVRLAPDAWRTQLEVQRPDLVLLDASVPWFDRTTLAEVRRRTDAPVVATAALAAALRGGPIDLVVDPADPDGAGAPAVDHRRHNPVGRGRPSEVRAVHEDASRANVLAADRKSVV